MLTHSEKPGTGLRRYDAAASRTDQVAKQFVGLGANVGPGHVLAGFKLAAPYLGYPRGVIHLIDALFAWTKAVDWRTGQVPIVWPRNELLSHKLGVGIRQTQNLLDHAVTLGLITHRDSPNGHRGGQRDADGQIKWAYGIVLSPLGCRLPEFIRAASEGRIEDEKVKRLKTRLAAARRKIREIGQALEIRPLVGISAIEDLSLAQMATMQMRDVRDVRLLASCVQQLEERRARLEVNFNEGLVALSTTDIAIRTADNSRSHAKKCIDSTTTMQLQSASAEYSNSFAKNSREGLNVEKLDAQSPTEYDLDKYQVDPEFISRSCPELCWDLDLSNRSWGKVVAIAERLVDQHSIHRKAWHDACRLMGERGAATSVIATVHKFNAGIVQRPGAYLRGMIEKAAAGELHLGKTMHGLKDLQQAIPFTTPKSGSRAIVSRIAQQLNANRRASTFALPLSGGVYNHLRYER